MRNNIVDENKEEELKKELVALGISRDFIDEKDFRNLHMAKRIVEGYNFGRELTQREKSALIYAVLNNAHLSKHVHRVLSALMQKFKQIGLEEQEIYGAIINLGVNGRILKQEGYGYDDLLHNSKNARKTIGKYKDQIEKRVSSTTILVAIADTLTEQGQQELKAELEVIGIDEKIIKQKDVQNLYMAKAVVEGYDFGRELTQREKYALIYAILNNAYLNRNTRKYLSLLMQKLEQIGLSEQEVYGTIINLGVNGIVVEESGYAYSDLLHDREKCNTIYKNKIETSVSSMTILTALSKNLNEQEEKELKAELMALGISREFIEDKRASNLYMAKTVVESYDFGREISKQEKRAFIQEILDIAFLNKNYNKYLSSLMRRFQRMGLEDAEIYAVIINLGINGSVIEEKGYGYIDLLINKANACERIVQYKDKIEKKVGTMTMLAATSRNINEQEEEELRAELRELGINEGVIEQKLGSNLYVAKRIVGGYDFGRELTLEEKRVLIQSILNNFKLDKKHDKCGYLSRLMQRFQQMGLQEQDIFGAMINLGVNGKVLDKIGGFGYSKLLMNEDNSCQEITKYREMMQTMVSEGTIQRALKKAEETMRSTVKKEKMEGQPETRDVLDKLVRQEIAQENVVEQEQQE